MSDVLSRYNEIEQLINDAKYDESIAGLNQIIAENEGFVLAHLALSRVYSKIGKDELAVKHGEKACELEPDDPFNFTALSVTYQRALMATQDMQYKVKAEDAMAKAHALNEHH